MKILFELSGSIAACKACTVISRLVQDGHEVQTIATEAALRFVGPATLEGLTGRPVRSDMWAAGTALDHLNLAKWADLVVLCPATAHTINRLAAGLADDLVGALFLAHDRRKPFLVRLHGNLARIEVSKDDWDTVLKHRFEITVKFRALDFAYITLDLEGYRTGSMDEVLR